MASEESTINKINALLAKAASTQYPAEAEECLRLADKLILKNAIDRAKLGVSEDRKSEVTAVIWNIVIPGAFYEQMHGLLQGIVYSCDCRMVYKFHRDLEVIGFPEDIKMAEALWLIAFREMTGHLWPSWDKNATFEANVYKFVKSGYKWKMIWTEAMKNDVIYAWPDGGRFKRAYERECKRRGEEPTPHTQRHEAFRLSYAEGFTSEIRTRIEDMRARSLEEVSEEDRFALARVPTYQEVNREFYKMYPQYDPENLRKQTAERRAAEEARRAAMTQEERDKEDAAKAKRQERDRKYFDDLRRKEYDSNGWNHGTKVARDVDLSMGKNHITPNRTELTS